MIRRMIMSVFVAMVMLFGFSSVATAQESATTNFVTADRSPTQMFIYGGQGTSRVPVVTCKRNSAQLQLGTLTEASATTTAMKKKFWHRARAGEMINVRVHRPDGTDKMRKFKSTTGKKASCR